MLAHVVHIIWAYLKSSYFFNLFTVKSLIGVPFVRGIRPKGRIKLSERLINSTNKACIPFLMTKLNFKKHHYLSSGIYFQSCGLIISPLRYSVVNALLFFLITG